jgi:3',5'-cyclic AMP phosphodiesterase CpdA
VVAVLIAQITDIHLGFVPDDPGELNRRRLDLVLTELSTSALRPDVLLATGDLTEFGAPKAYMDLKASFEACPFPVWPCLGNHDDRTAFATAFADVPLADDFVHYCRDLGPLRLIVIDTLEAGRHGGAFCPRRAQWLDARLSETPDQPTILALHHPPIDTGNGWMTGNPEAEWAKRLHAVVQKHPQIIRLVAGHVHRAMVTGWAGTTLAVCPSVSPQVAFDFRTMDPAQPDNRPMIVGEAPGFALHYWNGTDLISQFGSAGDHPVLARFDAAMQPGVQRILGEPRS